MFGLFEGPSAGEKQNYGALTSASGVATGTGEADLAISGDFMRGILSGDPSKISAVLAPTISAAKNSAQNQEKTTAMFGNRSGGNTAATAASADKVHSDITKAIAELTGTAASTLDSTGKTLLSTGMEGDKAAFTMAKTIQAEKAKMWNDLIKDIAATASGAMTGGAGGGGFAGALGGATGSLAG